MIDVRTILLLALLSPLLWHGCSRAPLPRLCPDLAPGALVVSELRGPQSPEDQKQLGQWIELLNRTDADVPINALRVRLRKLTMKSGRVLTMVITDEGKDTGDILIRDSDAVVPAGGYTVLGSYRDDDRPPHLGYGYALDYNLDLPMETARVEVYACERLLDRVDYPPLPKQGTLAFDGARPLDPDTNDDRDAWCADTTPAGDGGAIDLPGTPGVRNRPCSK